MNARHTKKARIKFVLDRIPETRDGMPNRMARRHSARMTHRELRVALRYAHTQLVPEIKEFLGRL